MKRRVFVLRTLADLSKHFAGRSLIKPNARIYHSDRFQHPGHTQCSKLGGEHGLNETGWNKGLGSQVVDLIRVVLVQYSVNRGLIQKISFFQNNLRAKVLDPFEMFTRGAPDNTYDLVRFLEEVLRQIRPILSGNAGYNRSFHG